MIVKCTVEYQLSNLTWQVSQKPFRLEKDKKSRLFDAIHDEQ